MRDFVATITLIVIAITALMSQAIADDTLVDRVTCSTASGDIGIAACTRLIGSGRLSDHDLAIAHYNQGNAYLDKGALDSAIADYNEAIRLNPKDAMAYSNRGDAYALKSDYGRATADYDQAIGLNPNLTQVIQKRENANASARKYREVLWRRSAALLLLFASVAAVGIERRGYDFISPLSQKLFVPLILGGMIAGLLAIYCLIKSEGWLAGLLIWFIAAVCLGGFTIRLYWDALISVLGILSLMVGGYLFWLWYL